MVDAASDAWCLMVLVGFEALIRLTEEFGSLSLWRGLGRAPLQHFWGQEWSMGCDGLIASDRFLLWHNG